MSSLQKKNWERIQGGWEQFEEVIIEKNLSHFVKSAFFA